MCFWQVRPLHVAGSGPGDRQSSGIASLTPLPVFSSNSLERKLKTRVRKEKRCVDLDDQNNSLEISFNINFNIGKIKYSLREDL